MLVFRRRGQWISDARNAWLRVISHRKFGAITAHYPAVGTSLLAMLAHFNGPDWTPDPPGDWKAAYESRAAA